VNREGEYMGALVNAGKRGGGGGARSMEWRGGHNRGAKKKTKMRGVGRSGAGGGDGEWEIVVSRTRAGGQLITGGGGQRSWFG